MNLFPDDARHAPFDGITYSEPHDGERLATQLNRVRDTLLRGGWWTLARLADHVGGSEAGVSARIRDLRKAKHGGYTVERRRVVGGNGLWEYRIGGV